MTNLKIFARRRIVCAVTVWVYLTFALVSSGSEQKFSTEPWRGVKKSLSEDYLGVDLELLIDSLTPKTVSKDEFEKSSDFGARLNTLEEEWRTERLYGELRRNSRVAVCARPSESFATFSRETFSLSSSYDADKNRIRVQIDFPEKPVQSYMSCREIVLETRNLTKYTLRYFPPPGQGSAEPSVDPPYFYLTDVDVERGRALKDNLGALVVFTPRYYSMRNSIYEYSSAPSENLSLDELKSKDESWKTKPYLYARNVELWVYDRTTFEPLAAFPIDYAIVGKVEPSGTDSSASSSYSRPKVSVSPFEIPIGVRIPADDDKPREESTKEPEPEEVIEKPSVNLDRWRVCLDQTKVSVQGWETRKPGDTLSQSERLDKMLVNMGQGESKTFAIPSKTTVFLDSYQLKYSLLPNGITFLGNGEGNQKSTIMITPGNTFYIPKGRRAYFKNIRFVFNEEGGPDFNSLFFIISGFATFKDCEFVGNSTSEKDVVVVLRGTAEFTRCRFLGFGRGGVAVSHGVVKASLCEFDGSFGKPVPKSNSNSPNKKMSKSFLSFGILGVDTSRVEVEKSYFHNCFAANSGDNKQTKTTIRDSFFADNFCDYTGANALLIQNQMWNEKEEDWTPLRLHPQLLP